jgi:hypothetical protein
MPCYRVNFTFNVERNLSTKLKTTCIWTDVYKNFFLRFEVTNGAHGVAVG